MFSDERRCPGNNFSINRLTKVLTPTAVRNVASNVFTQPEIATVVTVSYGSGTVIGGVIG